MRVAAICITIHGLFWRVAAADVDAKSSAVDMDDLCDTSDGTSSCALSALQRFRDMGSAVHPEQVSSKEAKTPLDHEAFIQFDGKTVSPATRKAIESGYAKEVLMSFPVQAGMKVEGSKVHIDNEQILQAEFARDAHLGNLERPGYGVIRTMMFTDSPMSMFSDNIVATMYEKTHDLWTENPPKNYSAEKVQQLRSPFWDFIGSLAPVRYVRNLMSTAFGFGMLGPQIILAGRDYNHQKTMGEYALADNGEPNAAAIATTARLRQQILERAQKSKEAGIKIEDPVQSTIACIHFESTPGLVYKEEYVELPLGKKIVAYRGRMSFGPNVMYNLATGYAVWTHNATTNTIDLFIAFSSSLHIEDGPDGFSANFGVGHADGDSWPIVPEGRNISKRQPFIFHWAWSFVQWLPGDYKFLYKEREDAGCPDSKLSHFTENSEQIRDLMSMGDDSVIDLMKSFWLVVDSIPCAIEYLRPDFDDVSAFNQFEALGLGHMLTEAPPKYIHAILAAKANWNYINRTLMRSAW